MLSREKAFQAQEEERNAKPLVRACGYCSQGPKRRLCAGSDRVRARMRREQKSEEGQGFPATQATLAFTSSKVETTEVSGGPNTIGPMKRYYVTVTLIILKTHTTAVIPVALLVKSYYKPVIKFCCSFFLHLYMNELITICNGQLFFKIQNATSK